MVLIVLAVVASAGCGRYGFDPSGGGSATDGAIDDAGDGMVGDAVPCVFGPWGTPVALAALNTAVYDESGAQIDAAGLTLYYSSASTGGGDFYVATRASRADAFTTSQPVASLNTANYETDASLAGDQLEVWFDSTRATGNGIYTASRASVASAWGPATEQTQLAPGPAATGPYLTPDGLTLVYSSSVDTIAEGNIYVSTRASRTVAFPLGTQIALPTGANVGYPALSGDALTIYFESETGAGGLTELWQASRATVGDLFGTPTRVPGVGQSGARDSDVSITADGLELYFSSVRGTGAFDLYVATRTCQ
jgi:hypothetical protein